MNPKLEDATAELWRVDQELKRLETKKKELRALFFCLADDELKKGTLGRVVVDIDKRMDYPGWNLIDTLDHGGSKVVILEENPSNMSFSYRNEALGVVFSRIIASVGEQFDDVRLREVYPDVALKVLTPVTTYELNEDAAQELVGDDPEALRVLQECTIPGKPQPRLSSRREREGDI